MLEMLVVLLLLNIAVNNLCTYYFCNAQLYLVSIKSLSKNIIMMMMIIIIIIIIIKIDLCRFYDHEMCKVLN